MRPMIAIPVMAGLLLAVSACFTRDERIVVRPDGSAAITYEMEGTAAEWAARPFVPGDLGWRLVRESTGERGGDPETSRVWQAELEDLNDYPGSFARPGDPRAGLAPRFETRLEVRREPDRVLYAFTRTYVGRRAGKFERLKDATDNSTLRASLEARAEREGLGSLTDQERDELFAGLADYEAAAMLLRARDALGAAVLEGLLPVAGYAGTVESLGAFLEERLTGPYLRRFFAAEEASQESELARLRAELRSEVESRIPGPHVDRILELLDREEERFRITQDLLDDHLWLEVELPGIVVGGNALMMEEGTAAWDFPGDALIEGDLVLTAVSVLEGGVGGGPVEPGR